MFQIRRLIELRLQGVSKRNLARILAMSRNTVQHYLTQLEAHFPDLQALLDWDDAQLNRLLASPVSPATKHPELLALFPAYERELARPGVTRQQLWLEYRRQYPHGVRYSQFNHLLRTWQCRQKVVMHLEHKAGEQLFIDFAGDRLELTDAASGQKRAVDVFVAILPCSQLTYAQAVDSQRQEDFINALQECLKVLGGVPQAIVPDNLKAAVSQADRYEPTINQTLQDFASHYQTVIFPARARKPRDKALVENAVRLIYQRVYAPLRSRTFYSLASLNEAIGQLVDQHNRTPLQAKNYSRQQRFEQVEKELLTPLPAQPYQLRHYAQAKVNHNGHVQLLADKHYYSVPYQLIGQTLKLIYSQQTVEIYHQYERVAVHQRQPTAGQYTTLREHLPPHHQWLSQHSPLFFCEQAAQIGPFSLALVEQLLASHSYAPQAYRSCSGILSLSKKYGKDRLERACQRALHFQATSYRFVRTILERDMDQLELETQTIDIPSSPPQHENIRGAQAYQ
ncbi:IS21-like element ISPsy14 family transposase [Nibrella saemangeumensis]|uniref:IS21-like element ISPsy14 family transposase n=1 Tax=Nibrella saemangeumensis TaxID=1084526 RepID=A0ABP8N0Q4_9BACT